MIEIKKQMKRITGLLNAHIASGDSAHLPADQDHAGFMLPSDKSDISQSLGNRVLLPTNTDVFKLQPGHYVGTNLVNSALGPSDGSLLMIDVKKADSSHVQIKETYSYNSQIFVHTIHNTNNGAPTGWSKVLTSTSLWSGNASASGTVLTLSDDVRKFASLRFTLNNQNQFLPVIEVKNAVTISIPLTNLVDRSPAVVAYEIHFSLNQSTGKTATITGNLSYLIQPTGVNNNTELLSVVDISGVS